MTHGCYDHGRNDRGRDSVSDMADIAFPTPQSTASRRERPAKAPLSRQIIIDVATAVLREEGVKRVTMRRVAQLLDTGHASLYVYVRDTEDLHAGILDAQLGAIDTRVAGDPAGDGDWTVRLKRLLRRYEEVLFEHPEIARMALSTRPNGPNYTALLEAVLALLNEGGVPDRAAAWGVDLLLLYPTAIAVEHSGPQTDERRAADEADLADRIATIDPATHPHIARLGDHLISGDGSSRSEWAFDVLIDGILAAGHRSG